MAYPLEISTEDRNETLRSEVFVAELYMRYL